MYNINYYHLFFYLLLLQVLSSLVILGHPSSPQNLSVSKWVTDECTATTIILFKSREWW